MSKNVNAGELRTPVKFIRIDRINDSDGYPAEVETEVMETKVKWSNVHGSEVFTAMQQQLREPATLMMRYSPLINQKLIIYKGADPSCYEVISIDDVEERHTWMEIKVQRKAGAV